MIISAKIQKKNAKWTSASIYVWCFIVLSSGAPFICVCCTAQRARGGCPLQGYCLLNLFTWPTFAGILFIRGTGRNWTAGLMTIGCLVVRLRLWQPWHTSVPPSTKLASLDTPASSQSVSTISSDISLACSNCRLLLSRLILHQHAHRLSNAELEITSSLCNTTLWFETHSDVWEVKHNLTSRGPSKEKDGVYRSVYCSLSPHYACPD